MNTLKKRIIRWLGGVTTEDIASTLTWIATLQDRIKVLESEDIPVIHSRLHDLSDTVRRAALKIALDDITKMKNDH